MCKLARELTDQVVPGKVHSNTIHVLDEPGDGNACHEYVIRVDDFTTCGIIFQKGPISAENPPNGIHGEDLLAIQIDRLRGFQSGPFACRENEIALTHLETALMWLQKRTRDRMARGVEGTHEK